MSLANSKEVFQAFQVFYYAFNKSNNVLHLH